jgi:hypothetical protein
VPPGVLLLHSGNRALDSGFSVTFCVLPACARVCTGVIQMVSHQVISNNTGTGGGDLFSTNVYLTECDDCWRQTAGQPVLVLEADRRTMQESRNLENPSKLTISSSLEGLDMFQFMFMFHVMLVCLICLTTCLFHDMFVVHDMFTVYTDLRA